jgi:hypothetical protein
MRRGLTMVEVLVAFVILGGLTMGAVQAIREADASRGRYIKKIRLTGLRHRFRNLMGSHQWVREVLINEAANGGLKSCLLALGGECSGRLESSDFSSEAGLPPLELSYRDAGPNLIEISARMDSKEPPFNGFRLVGYLVRSEFWRLRVPRDREQSERLRKCAQGKVAVGVDVSVASAICEVPSSRSL